MSADSNPMVPGTHWGGVVEGFDTEIGKQDLLCAPCAELGDLTPPRYVIVRNGESLCIDHFNSRVHGHG